MTNRDALSILDQVTAKLPLDRRGNSLVIQAIQTLDAFVNKHDPLPATPPNVGADEGPGKKKK